MTTTPLAPSSAAFDRSVIARGTKKQRGVVAYDFRRPIQLSKEHARLLEVALDSYARSATTAFTSVLRSIATVSLASVEQLSYTEYIASLGQQTFMTIVDTDPLPGVGVLEIPIGSVMLCIDYMLGGIGATRQPTRNLTEIEANVMSKLVQDRLLDELRDALAHIAPFSFSVRDIEYSPQFALASSTADQMVVATFDIRFHEHQTRMTLALPFTGLTPYLVQASAPNLSSGREAQKIAQFTADLHREFADVPVDVSIQLRETTLQPDFITQLQVGDIIPLSHPQTMPFEVTVDNNVYAHARIGRRHKMLAASIVAVETKEETP